MESSNNLTIKKSRPQAAFEVLKVEVIGYLVEAKSG